MSATIEDIKKRLQVREASQPNRAVGRTELLNEVKSRLSGVDPEFDYSGVKDTRIRFGLAAMDTREEQESFLTDKVGENGFTSDRFGNLALTLEGLERLNIKNQGNPVIIDEPGLSKQDFVELAADAPAIIGGVAGGIAGIPGGPVISAELAGLGAATGKVIGEKIEEKMGLNLQSQSDVARSAAAEVPLAAAGEFGARAVGAVGKKMLAPEASRMTDETRALVGEARELGTKPTITQITKAPILGRTQNMLDLIFGNPVARQNEKALRAEMTRLKTGAGGTAKRGTVGETAKADIRNARRGLSKWASDAYGTIDDLVTGPNGEQAVRVSTQKLKESANELKEALPKDADGNVVLTDPQTTKSLGDVLSLDDEVSFRHMQRIRNRLFNAIGDDSIVPGISSRDARGLWKATGRSFDDVVGDDNLAREFRDGLKSINATYQEQIGKFDNAFIQRIVRNPRLAGGVQPEQLVQTIFKKGQHTNLNRVFKVLPETTKKKIRRVAMEDILGNLTERTEDPLVEVFQGKKFLNMLDSYGKDTLNAMFGEEQTKALFKLGRVSQFVNQRMKMSGGLVAANLALHPWKNFGRIVKLKLLSNFMNSESGVKWLTEGLDLRNTRTAGMALSRITAQAIALGENENKPAEETE